MSRHMRSRPDASELVRQQDLQVANGVFLGVIAARIPLQLRAACIVHADVMSAFVQHRMQRRIEPRQ